MKASKARANHASQTALRSNLHPTTDAVQRVLSRSSASVAGAALVTAISLSAVTASADEIVYLEGVMTTTETTGAQSFLGSAEENFEGLPDLCGNSSNDLDDRRSDVFHAPIVDAYEQLQDTDPALAEEFRGSLSEVALDDAYVAYYDALDRACEAPDTQVYPVKLIYSTCRMTMRDGTNMIDVRFPPGTNNGFFTFLDPATFQATVMPFQAATDTPISVNFAELMNEETGAIQGYDGGRGIDPPGAREEIEVLINGENVTLTGRERGFEFTFELNLMASLGAFVDMEGQSADAAELAQLESMMSLMPTPRIISEGTALIVPEVEGLDIIRTFYQTFASVMGAEGSYLAGLYNHGLLAAGFPIRMEQTTEMRMDTGALFGGLAGMFGGGEQSTSTMEIMRIVGPLTSEADFCTDSIVPSGYTVTDPMSGLSSGGGGGAGNAPGSTGAGAPGGLGGLGDAFANDPEAAAAMAEGMAELNTALENMSPEDRAAMEQLGGGFGALFGGAFGGAPGGLGLPGAAPAAAPSGSSGSTPSSSDLMTGDLTQSAQNMLQALGFEPGNTDGELTTATVVAISQFQAEQGLDVTGEVTPQLVGILAAAVDAR